MKKHFFRAFIFLSLFSVGMAAQAQPKKLPADLEIPLQYGADRLGKRQDAAMQKFRDNRLGAFIHLPCRSSATTVWARLFIGDCTPFPAANGTGKYTKVQLNG